MATDRTSRQFIRIIRAILVTLAVASLAPTGRAAAQQQQQETQSQGEAGFLREPPVMSKTIEYFGNHVFGTTEGGVHNGFYPELGNMVTGSGWISVGPGYRHGFDEGQWLVDTSAAISWRAYNIAQARVEYRPKNVTGLAIGSQGLWQDFTQVEFFGVGTDSLKSNRSAYRVQDVDVVGYANYRIKQFTIDGDVGWLKSPTFKKTAGPFDADWPDTRNLLGEAGAPGITEPVAYLHGGAGVSYDYRDARGYSTRGGFYRAAWQHFADRDRGAFSFDRYDVEGSQFVPIVPNRWVIALRGWAVFSDASSGQQVPFYLMPSLGGHNTLRGFADYRFHDNDLLVANVESRWALYEHVDAALFFDAGNVAPRAGDLNFDHKSVGAGLRVHTKKATLVRLDLGHSTEGWRILFKMDDALAMGRLARHITTVPFVP
jgi:hypothetical protein